MSCTVVVPAAFELTVTVRAAVLTAGTVRTGDELVPDGSAD